MIAARKVPILIVDDRPENLRAMEAVLADMALELVTVQSGNEALGQTLKQDFALVLLDVQMPEMDGFETAEWLRTNPKTRHLPIIFITAGINDDRHLFKGYEAGAVDFLLKPIEPAVLRGKVQVFCDLARQRQVIEEHERTLEELVRQRTAALTETVQALRISEEALREANLRKDEFLATLAHELRNPLAPIRTGAFILGRQDTQDPKVRQIHEMISRQSAHMARLVDDLLDVSRIERGKVDLRKERVDLRLVVDHALETCREGISEKMHHVTVALPVPAPDLEADPVRLGQMLCNLLRNACKYTPEGGEIRIAAVREGADVVISVRDNGVGMTPEEVSHSFDLFYQAVPPFGRPPVGGLGIGLTLVRRLAHLHGGSVIAQSDGPGKGSEFTLRLPVPESTPLATPTAPTAAHDSADRRRHVLIIDDDDDVRMASCMLLKAQGYKVTLAATGEMGIEQARTLRPEVALIDLSLPGLNGLEVAAQIRADLGHAVYLVAYTGYSRGHDIAEARAAGFDEHQVKSADPNVLLNLLSSIPYTPDPER